MANGKCSVHADPLRPAQLARKARDNRYRRDEVGATAVLSAELLDSELVKAVCAPMMPGLAAAKMAALEMAYARLGISVGPVDPQPHSTMPPSLYEAIFQQLQQREQNASGEPVARTAEIDGLVRLLDTSHRTCRQARESTTRRDTKG